MQPAHHFVKQHAQRFRDEFEALLRIPSISTLDEHAPDVERAAAWLLEDMRRIGLTRTEIFQEEGFLPLVYGEWTGAGPDAPTVLVYSHYDVQPAFRSDGWHTEPFEPTEINGRLYARGSLDSKCHVIAQLKAVEAILATGTPPVNIKLLFEGEEESGSEHIFRFVAQNPKLLAADVAILSDGSLPDENQPTLVFGLRGLMSMELTVTGPQRDLHSGHYGGTVHNPIQALAEIIAHLHDADGRVTVPGFYDGVRSIDDDERALLSAVLPWVEREWQSVAAAPQPWGESDYSLNERIGTRPTLEFNGVFGGYTGSGVKTVLPMQATTKITCRLVPDQDPHQVYAAIEAYIKHIAPSTVKVELKPGDDASPGILIPRDTAAIRAAAKAYAQGWGVDPIYTREGGSIPVVTAFNRDLNSDIVLMPFGYKGGGAHSTNEYMVLDMFYKGIHTMLYFYEALAATSPTPASDA